MKDLLLNNRKLQIDSIDYSIINVSANDEYVVTIELQNDRYHFHYALASSDITINNVLQTSAQMIIDTLSNGQS